ncbi:MAG TPA: hypothetical protein VMW19_13060 [Myxococcota bacterium]|nr:hypothetical protein [Myxococcota bacterium]
MLRDFTFFLWLLKLGALLNLTFLFHTFVPPESTADPSLSIPAQILFAVSAFRCLFPNQYKHNVVFHDTPLSSIFLTRLLATVTEVAFVYQLSRVIRLLDVDRIGWVDALSWLMVVQVVVSQFFVWGAILTGRLALYFWEELGWAILVAANAVASAGLYPNRGALGDAAIFLRINLLFAVVYLSWQVANLRLQIADARRAGETLRPWTRMSRKQLAAGLRRALHERNPTTDATAWGGLITLLWMAGYFATLLPMWADLIVRVFSR